MPRLRSRRRSLALMLAGAVLLAVGFWPRAAENGRTFDPETGVVSHEQTVEAIRILGIVMGTAGLCTLVLSWRRRPAAPAPRLPE